MDFKTIFGEEALTLAQFQEKTKDMKLVDLSGGEYVAKGRFDGVNAELTKSIETTKALEENKQRKFVQEVIPASCKGSRRIFAKKLDFP